MAEYDHDLFISHASENKGGFVRELVENLVSRGLRVWFDEAELQVGDTLTRKIDEGLARSRFGVVVLSQAFFRKPWPRTELDALASIEIRKGEVVVLPIWLDVSHADVESYSPTLASKLALQSSAGIEAVADDLERRVRGGESSTRTAAVSRPTVRLQPELLRGRMFPYSYAPIIRSDERALVCRVALAAGAPLNPEPRFRSSDQDLFEEALEESSLERLMHGMTTPLPRHPGASHWQLVEPTKSWIMTASRPAAKMIVDGWTVEGRSSTTLKPAPSAVPAGWLTLTLDTAIRPVDGEPAAVDAREWKPLSLDDLAELLFVSLTSLMDEVAPVILGQITESPPLAITCLLMPNGDELTRYVALERYASRRVEGATGPHAIDWYASALTEVSSPEARFAMIRGRIEDLFADGGYRGYEQALQQLAMPRTRTVTP